MSEVETNNPVFSKRTVVEAQSDSPTRKPHTNTNNLSPKRCLIKRFDFVAYLFSCHDRSKPPGTPNPLHCPDNPLRPTEFPWVHPNRPLSHFALLVPPTTILLPHRAVEMRVLISVESTNPLRADGGRVQHDVYFLTVVPGLGVLVAVALDGEVGVDDEDFDWCCC